MLLCVLGFGQGDPHITTTDGFSYTFNGLGEYWMVRPKNDVGAFMQVSLCGIFEIKASHFLLHF